MIFDGTDGYLVMTSYSERRRLRSRTARWCKSSRAAATTSATSSRPSAAANTRTCNADILEGHLSSALCHLGNISYRSGTQVSVGEVKERLQGRRQPRALLDTYGRFTEHLNDNKLDLGTTKLAWGAKLAIDTATREVRRQPAADALLTREYRAPFVVPPAGQV